MLQKKKPIFFLPSWLGLPLPPCHPVLTDIVYPFQGHIFALLFGWIFWKFFYTTTFCTFMTRYSMDVCFLVSYSAKRFQKGGGAWKQLLPYFCSWPLLQPDVHASRRGLGASSGSGRGAPAQRCSEKDAGSCNDNQNVVFI